MHRQHPAAGGVEHFNIGDMNISLTEQDFRDLVAGEILKFDHNGRRMRPDTFGHTEIALQDIGLNRILKIAAEAVRLHGNQTKPDAQN